MSFFSDFLLHIVDFIGLVGVFIILWYYFLLQIGKCLPDSLSFSVANFIGAILILISLWFNWNLSSVVIEVAWLLISFYGICIHYNRTTVRKNSDSSIETKTENDHT